MYSSASKIVLTEDDEAHNILTQTKEEHHPRSFQNPSNVHPATDHMIHQNTNLDHAMDATECITVEENVKRNIGRGRIGMGTRRTAK